MLFLYSYKSIYWSTNIDNKYLFTKSSLQNSMEITQFYVPKSNMKLKLFKNINNDFIDNKDLLELIHQTDDNPLPAGI